MRVMRRDIFPYCNGRFCFLHRRKSAQMELLQNVHQKVSRFLLYLCNDFGFCLSLCAYVKLW